MKVAALRVGRAGYPADAPFHPSVPYPEYPFGGHRSSAPNEVYDGVRQLFVRLGLDAGNFGTARWNPLGHLIQPGMTVVLKPNFVLSRHAAGKDLFSIVTHPSVLRAAMDYCWIALKGSGRILVADAPQYDCNVAELMAATRLPEMMAFYRAAGAPVDASVLDLRPYWSPRRHFASMLQPLPGDPAGSVTVDLGERSAMAGKPHPEKLYGAVYRRNETITQHTGGRHAYALSRTILEADVVISVPKLKVHKKVGATLNAKGLVGIATNKNHLVHYSLTPPSRGGDQYPDGLLTPVEQFLIRTERWMYDHLLAAGSRPLEYLHRATYWIHNHSTRRLGLKVDERKRLLDAGNWHGNDSAWRMTLDLLRLFYFADARGVIQDTPQRRMFSIVDGVVGGDGNGPLTPDPVDARTLLAGEDLLSVDLVATRLMGFDPRRLRLYAAALADPQFAAIVPSLDAIQIESSEVGWTSALSDTRSGFLGFAPHPGWVGRIEVTAPEEAA
ncbi:MAG TPA: DUF362 domain-containing protein [Vicinamibacterales bacterium]|nr:DUF362 domain-containing protein [Vicinamibacterales bacterium]